MRRNKTSDRSPSVTKAAFGCSGVRTTDLERHHRGSCPVFHAQLAENVLDVFANRAGLGAENDANIMIAFAPRNPEEDFGFPRRQL